MHLTSLDLTNAALLEKVQAIYDEAIPPQERWSFAQFLTLAQKQPRFTAHLIWVDAHIAGVASYWRFEEPCAFGFIECIAIDRTLRGKSLGTQTMQTLLAHLAIPVVLEVEPPQTEQAIQRIRFYERLGFTIWDRTYIQPAYASTLPEVPMFLMVNAPLEASLCKPIAQVIRREVYEAHRE